MYTILSWLYGTREIRESVNSFVPTYSISVKSVVVTVNFSYSLKYMQCFVSYSIKKKKTVDPTRTTRLTFCTLCL